MKRTVFRLAALLSVFLPVPVLAACGGCDYSAYISEARSDIFLAQTEAFTVTVSCLTREYPYISDGIVCPTGSLVEISLVPAVTDAEGYAVYLTGEISVGGETTYRTYAGDYYFSQGVEVFPSGSVDIEVVHGEETISLSATSVKSDKTLTVKEALSSAIAAEKETVSALTQGNSFSGEFYVRLLKRDAAYYYVGIVDRNGKTLSLLLDSESGEILARRQS